MNVSEMIEAAHEQAVKSGFWDDLTRIGFQIDMNDEPSEEMKTVENMAVAQKLALISTEIMEFEVEASRLPRNRDAMLEELADVVIRIFDLAGYLRLPIANSVLKGRLHLYSTATGVALALYRNVATAVQAHRKEETTRVLTSLEDAVRVAQDFAAYTFEDSYALVRAIEMKMEKNRSRPHKHNASY